MLQSLLNPKPEAITFLTCSSLGYPFQVFILVCRSLCFEMGKSIVTLSIWSIQMLSTNFQILKWEPPCTPGSLVTMYIRSLNQRSWFCKWRLWKINIFNVSPRIPKDSDYIGDLWTSWEKLISLNMLKGSEHCSRTSFFNTWRMIERYSEC